MSFANIESSLALRRPLVWEIRFNNKFVNYNHDSNVQCHKFSVRCLLTDIHFWLLLLASHERYESLKLLNNKF